MFFLQNLTLVQVSNVPVLTRVRFQPKKYEPTMTGSKYSYGVMQLETQGVLHPDYHMFIQEDFSQSNPDVMAHIMTQLSLTSGLK